MNTAMTLIFGFLNALAALAIIVVGFVAGNMIGHVYYLPGAASIGAALGVLVAALFCGPMALLVAMHGELRHIRKLQ